MSTLTGPRVRPWAVSVAVFLTIVVVGGWPFPAVRAAVARAHAAWATVVLGQMTFGGRGHAHMAALPLDPQAPDTATAAHDAQLLLRVDGYAGAFPVPVNVRRDAHVPLLLLVAAALAAPLPWRGRLRCLAVGLPALHLLWLASMAVLTAWAFAHRLEGIYPPSTFVRVIDALTLGWVAPPSNKFLVPLALAVALLYTWGRAKPTPAVQ